MTSFVLGSLTFAATHVFVVDKKTSRISSKKYHLKNMGERKQGITG
jgi:hypothetical protein